MIRFMTVLVVALLSAGCAQTATEGAKLPAGEKLKVTQAAWSDYQDYLTRGDRLGHKKMGAFAVVLHEGVGVSGGGSWFYCPRDYDGCRTQGGENATENILNACRREGLDCMIFARNDMIQIPYEIID